MTRDEALTLRPGDVVILRDLEWRVVAVGDRTSTVLVQLERRRENALTFCELIRKPTH